MSDDEIARAKICAPDPCPDAYKDAVAKLQSSASFQFDTFEIPYAIQAKMATQRYTCLDDIAERWPLDTVRASAEADLDFDSLHYDANDKKFYITRLVHVVKKAREILHNSSAAASFGVTSPLQMPGNQQQPCGSLAMSMVDKNQRAKLIAAWKARAPTHPQPKLTQMGSPEMIKRMMPTLEGGEIPHVDIRHIIPAQLEINDRPIVKSVWQKNQYGAHIETEEKITKFPQDRKTWEKSLVIWQNTFLMAIWTLPCVPEFNITKEDLDDFYTFFLGREIASRQPEPPLTTLIHLERNIWKEINIVMTDGMKLKEALTHIRNNGLFWMQALNASPHYYNNQQGANQYHNPHQGGTRAPRNKKNKTKVWGGFNKQRWNGTNMPQWSTSNNNGGANGGYNGGDYAFKGGNNNYKAGDGGNNKGFWKGGKPIKGRGKFGKVGNNYKGLGKGKGGNNGKGKGKGGNGKGGNTSGKGGKWDNNWANQDMSGKEICRNFHTTGCNNGNDCMRSHKCPKMDTTGYKCLGPHRAQECPRFP